MSGMEGVVLHMNPAELVASPHHKHLLHSSRPPEFGQDQRKRNQSKKDADVKIPTWLRGTDDGRERAKTDAARENSETLSSLHTSDSPLTSNWVGSAQIRPPE